MRMTMAEVLTQRGIEKGIVEGVERVALEMLKIGLEIPFIASVTKLSPEHIKSLAQALTDQLP
jgi:predicted transposase YdaD